MLKRWEELPGYMRNEAVRPYYNRLRKRQGSLLLKRVFDFMAAILLLTFLLPVMAVIAAFVASDSKGGVFFLQERVTQYGRRFKIFKFRTMASDGEMHGPQVTAGGDGRVTAIGKVLRRYRLDELPQLINIILGDMSFCGTRPEVPCFVRQYTPEMMATLLLPAGVTSMASIRYKDEERLLEGAEDVAQVYIRDILPEKMKYNLWEVRKFGFWREIGVIVRTVAAVVL